MVVVVGFGAVVVVVTGAAVVVVTGAAVVTGASVVAGATVVAGSVASVVSSTTIWARTALMAGASATDSATSFTRDPPLGSAPAPRLSTTRSGRATAVMIAVYLSHLRAGERFRTAQRALLSQYPMLILMIGYTMVSLSILAAIFIPLFLVLELRHREPFINLRLLRRPAFASASMMGLVLGLSLYGTVYLLPVYLSQIQGYNALQIGEVIMWLGLPQLAIFPFVPMVMRRVDRTVDQQLEHP